MILSLLTSKLLVPKYLELATEIIQSAMTDPVVVLNQVSCLKRFIDMTSISSK